MPHSGSRAGSGAARRGRVNVLNCAAPRPAPALPPARSRATERPQTAAGPPPRPEEPRRAEELAANLRRHHSAQSARLRVRARTEARSHASRGNGGSWHDGCSALARPRGPRRPLAVDRWMRRRSTSRGPSWTGCATRSMVLRPSRPARAAHPAPRAGCPPAASTCTCSTGPRAGRGAVGRVCARSTAPGAAVRKFAANGPRLTAAFEVSLGCDLLVAGERRSSGWWRSSRPHASMGGPQRLAERAGPARARELVFTGGAVDAATSRPGNVVNRVLPARRLRRRRARSPRVCRRSTKAQRCNQVAIRRQIEGGARAAD